MARFLLNPTFDIETGKLLFHDGEFFEEPRMLFDRGAVNQAKSQGQQAGGVAANSQSQANTEYSSIVPGLIRQANNPYGFTAQQKNNMLTQGAEAAGGANATATGEGRLAALRSRTAGGFAPALDEAAREKGRQLSGINLDVQNRDAMLANQRQLQAQQMLQGLYGTDTSNMLHAMGIQSQDLQNQLAAGRQGWLQNTEGVIDTIANAGKAGAGAYSDVKNA
jgi:hypothetical protein